MLFLAWNEAKKIKVLEKRARDALAYFNPVNFYAKQPTTNYVCVVECQGFQCREFGKEKNNCLPLVCIMRAHTPCISESVHIPERLPATAAPLKCNNFPDSKNVNRG